MTARELKEGRLFQDFSFTVDHLGGRSLERLIGACEQDLLRPVFVLLKAGGLPWQRFFLDAGCGFWGQYYDLDLGDELEDLVAADYCERFHLSETAIQSVQCAPVGVDRGSSISIELASGTFELRPDDPDDIESRCSVVFRPSRTQSGDRP